MMTEPETRDGMSDDERYRKASSEPRGDWGDVGFRILDDEDEEETDDAGS